MHSFAIACSIAVLAATLLLPPHSLTLSPPLFIIPVHPLTSTQSAFIAWLQDGSGITTSLMLAHFNYVAIGGPSLMRGLTSTQAIEHGDIVLKSPRTAMLTGDPLSFATSPDLAALYAALAGRSYGGRSYRDALVSLLLYYSYTGRDDGGLQPLSAMRWTAIAQTGAV